MLGVDICVDEGSGDVVALAEVPVLDVVLRDHDRILG